MLDTRFDTIAAPPTQPSMAMRDTAKYEGGEYPNLPYYRRSRKRQDEEEKEKEKRPAHVKDENHQVDFMA